MRCLSCNYDLRDLTEHRCPECGLAFDPNDAKTYYSGPNRKPAIWGLSLALCCFSLIILLLFMVPIAPFRTGLDVFVFAGSPMSTFRLLVGLFALAWLGCAITLSVTIVLYRRETKETVPR